MTSEMRAADERFIRVPISEISTPKNGRICFGQRWWHVTTNDEVLFFRKKWHSPQCNSNEAVVRGMPIEGCEPRYIEMVYLPHSCDDYI
jgi:hypothetical protein